MALLQSIDSAVGTHGVSTAALDAMLARAEEALDWLRTQRAGGKLPLLHYPEKTDDLGAIRAAAAALTKNASDVVILGTGGSSLGAQALAQLRDYAVPGARALRSPPRLHFMDNLDGETFEIMLAKLALKTTRFVAVSKSGGTAETVMQTIAAITALKAAGLKTSEHMFGVTEAKANGMRALLSAEGVTMLEHDPGVGGRFSVLTNVGLLPAAMFGLDIAAVRKGAAAALAPVLAKKPAKDVPAAVGAALAVALADKKTISVVMAYADRLERFTRWYVQLWGESLGKNGKGTTPVAALMPVDQHSQLQLYLGGPRDKLFTVITMGNAGGPRIDATLAKTAGEPGLGGKSIGDLVAAQGRATTETLAKNGCPVRTIHLAKLDEASLGELMMHFMLETIIAARVLGVDAFDQPAVEEGKRLAKKYLGS